MTSINLKTTHLPYSLSAAKPNQSTSSAKSIQSTPALPYSLSTFKPDQSKAGLKSILPTPAPPYSLKTFKPARSKALAKPVPPTLALEWSKWPKTKPIRGKFEQPFDEQTKDSLQVDFNFFGMDDGEDTVFELREGKDHGLYQTRSDFENNIALYQRVRVEGRHGNSQACTFTVNVISEKEAANVVEEVASIKTTAQLKSIAKVKKSASGLGKGVDYNSAAENEAGDKGEELAGLKSNEDKFWRSKNTANQSIEELLSGDTSTTKKSTTKLQIITTHNELIKHCELLYASNTRQNRSIIYTGKSQSTADAIAEGDEKRVNQLLEMGVSYEAIDPLWKHRPTHPRVCKCGCQKNEAPHSFHEWCRCGCGHYYVYEG